MCTECALTAGVREDPVAPLDKLFSQESLAQEKAQQAFEVGCVSLGGLGFSG